MIALSDKDPADNPGFIFVGDHPAIDFANALSMSQGQSIDHLRVWDDVIDWLSLAGVSTDPALRIPTSRSAEAVKGVVEFRRAWKAELDKLVAGGNVSDEFIKQSNHLLAEDVFHETLHRAGKTGFLSGPLGLSTQRREPRPRTPCPADRTLPGRGELWLPSSLRQYRLMCAL